MLLINDTENYIFHHSLSIDYKLWSNNQTHFNNNFHISPNKKLE